MVRHLWLLRGSRLHFVPESELASQPRTGSMLDGAPSRHDSTRSCQCPGRWNRGNMVSLSPARAGDRALASSAPRELSAIYGLSRRVRLRIRELIVLVRRDLGALVTTGKYPIPPIRL